MVRFVSIPMRTGTLGHLLPNLKTTEGHNNKIQKKIKGLKNKQDYFLYISSAVLMTKRT